LIDVDETLRVELHRLVAIDPRRDWDEVLAGAGEKRRPTRRRWALAVAVVLAAAILAVATPLGPAIGKGLGDFSAWLTGQPGSRVSGEEQLEFEAENARGWVGFPQGTQLRRLITARAGKATVDLLGFRSGTSTFCLRLTVIGKSRLSRLSCASLAELRHGGPARVVITDHPIGKGDKVAWYGINRIHSAKLQITAGIVTDGVSRVVLEDDAGRHEVAAASNAFLYVAEQPKVAQLVKRVWARTTAGLVPVPFTPWPFGFGGSAQRAPAPAAPAIERQVRGGRIRWLEDHEPRGDSLDVLPTKIQNHVFGRVGGPRPTNVLFGRVLAPDPDRPVRVAMTLNAHRPGGPPAGVCPWLVTRSRGGAGGCMPYPGVFDHSLMAFGMSADNSDTYATVGGITSDDVARIDALLAHEQRVDVPLKDNAFVVDLPRAKLPARLVARDANDDVIAVSPPIGEAPGGPSQALGRPTSRRRVVGPDGSWAELLVGPSTAGGECMFIRHFIDRRHGGVSLSCTGRVWTGQPLQLNSVMQPLRFIGGRVRSDIKTVRIRFADRTSSTLTPTRGYVLWAASQRQLAPKRAAVAAEALNASGHVIGRNSFIRPP
jgi:hypothetical protein